MTRAILSLAVVGLLASAAPAGANVTTAQRDAAVRWAVKQVGTHENGATNCSPVLNKWERDMGLHLPPCRPWCGAFVHQAFRRAGIRLSARLIDPDRSYGDARAGRRGLKAIAIGSVKRGDLLFFAFRPGLKASHLAIARGPVRNGEFETVEGNVANAVRLKRRGTQYPVLAARVVGNG